MQFDATKGPMMPTGYTAKLYEGEEQTFPEFVLSCAHAFGALVTMRDQAVDSPIPDEFQPDSHHEKQIRIAKARLVTLGEMTPENAARHAKEDHDQAVIVRDKARAERDARRERYEAMLADVDKWQPPTEEHQGLKEFMADQLRESIKFDCGMDYWPELPTLDGEEWMRQQVAKAERDVAYHTEEHQKEVERTEERNAWVRALRESLSSV